MDRWWVGCVVGVDFLKVCFYKSQISKRVIPGEWRSPSPHSSSPSSRCWRLWARTLADSSQGWHHSSTPSYSSSTAGVEGDLRHWRSSGLVTLHLLSCLALSLILPSTHTDSSSSALLWLTRLFLLGHTPALRRWSHCCWGGADPSSRGCKLWLAALAVPYTLLSVAHESIFLLVYTAYLLVSARLELGSVRLAPTGSVRVGGRQRPGCGGCPR